MPERRGRWILSETSVGIAMSYEYAGGQIDKVPTLIRRDDIPDVMDQMAKIMGSVPQYPDLSRARLWIKPFRSLRDGENEKIRFMLVTSTGEVLPGIFNLEGIRLHIHEWLSIVETFDLHKRMVSMVNPPEAKKE